MSSTSSIPREERWPEFAQAAYDAGARSMLCFQLFVKGDNLGALNLYGENVDVFDEESEQVGKGILMERFKITSQQAFQVLTRASSESETKLRDVADQLTSSGEIPTRRRD